MLLPLGLIRNLQMNKVRKMSIAGLFCLGWVCIAVSTIRVAYLGHNGGAGEYKQPSTSWLALWGIVESGIGRFCAAPFLAVQNIHLTHWFSSRHHRVWTWILSQGESGVQGEHGILQHEVRQRAEREVKGRREAGRHQPAYVPKVDDPDQQEQQ
jgi:rhodopsin domain-containing protein